MKTITFIAFIVLSLTLASCGGDKKSSNSGSFSNSLSTREGYYNTQTGALEVGGTTYPANPAYASVMNMALQQAQMSGVQPINVNGVPKFRARITASIINYNQNVGFNQYQNYQNYNQAMLQLQSVQLY